MESITLTLNQWLLLVHFELLLFAAVFLTIGAIDEIAVDMTYLWLRLSGRAKTPKLPLELEQSYALDGRAAVLIPAWNEAEVIGATMSHALAVWPHPDLRLYVGCYREDPATVTAAMAAAQGDPRVRIVMMGYKGPTNKSDCLNRLYRALCDDELRTAIPVRMVVLHDAEDMVDPAALTLFDQTMSHADFAQLPVLAMPQERSRWIAGHYGDEFAEAHGKVMVVRGAIGAGLPSAGVGTAIARPMLARLAQLQPDVGPFPTGSLTEDYELGLRVAAMGGKGRFLRWRAQDGRLIATRAFFPAQLNQAVRQKTRWTHGIALQGWDRLGWIGGGADMWMQLRDRRGPFAALILALGYILVLATAAGLVAQWAGVFEPLPLPLGLKLLLLANTGFFIWRAVVRAMFSAREFGWREGVLAILRIPVSNVIAIMATRRALAAYMRSLRGAPVIWDKTEHQDHPVKQSSATSSVVATA